MSITNQKSGTKGSDIDRFYIEVAEIFKKYSDDMESIMKKGSKKEKETIKAFFWDQAVSDVIFTYTPFTVNPTKAEEKKH